MPEPKKVKIRLPDGSTKEVSINSAAYKTAYNSGNIMSKYGDMLAAGGNLPDGEPYDIKKDYKASNKAYNNAEALNDKGFQNWYEKNTLEGKNGSPYTDSQKYDYYSFYKNKGEGNIKEHFPDTYKRPSHPTFSNESIYSTPENPGGSWEGEKYTPDNGLRKKAYGGEVQTNEFKTGGFVPDPTKKNRNLPPIATRQDSLDAVRNSQEVNDFYIGQNYPKDGLNTPTHEGIFNSLDEKYKDFVNKYKNGIQTNNTSGGSSIGEAYEPRFYRKNVDGNKFYQRETADNVINFEAPMALYNRNIMPHHLNYYRKNMGMVGDDIVSIPMYDILATTPADMLTDEQLIKRVQEFGPKSIPNSRLRKLGLPLNEDTPSASSLKRKEDRDTFDRQLKEAGLYNRAEGVTGRNPDASRMYEEYMRSKQPSQSNVLQVPNQVQSAGEAIKQPIEERIPEGYQINRGYTREGVTYGDVYNPTTAQGKTYPIPGSPTMEDYERLYGDGKGNVNTPKRTGTRTVRAKFAAGGTPPTDPPYENDSTKVYNQSLIDLANLNNRYPIGDGKERVVDKGGMTEAEVKSHMAELTASSGVNNASYYLLDDSYDAVYNKFPGIEPSGYNVRDVYRKRPGSRALAIWTPTDKPVNRLGNLDDGPPLNNKKYGDVVAGEDGNLEYVKSDAFGNHDIPESYEDWVLRTHITPIYAEPKGTSKTKPRSESSLKREEARNILKKEMDTLGFTGYSAREVSKKGSEAEKAYQKHLGNYTETTAVETPKVVETPTKPEVTKPKVTLPKGYSYTQHESRDEDMNDYFFTNKNGSKKRISREDFIKNTNYSPTQFRERHVEIPEFRDGGPINNDGPLAKPQGDIYLPLDGTRPSYIDASGKERSEYKIGVGTKEGEMVIPTVWNGEQHTEDEAIDRYYNTGEHMGGPYDSIEEGERAAKLRTFLYNEHPAYRKKAYGGCAPKYAQGGQLYEAEGGEVIDGGNPITLQGGHISPNSSNSGKIVGNSHGNGGVKMTGGEKIYSDRLKVDASFLKDLNI